MPARKKQPLYWVLEGHKPVPTDDSRLFGEMYQTKKGRVVATTDLGDYFVSTVFLGIDHNWGSAGDPVLFETMVFSHGGATHLDGWTLRYCTWDEAAAGHEAVVYKITNQLEVPE